MGPSIAQPAQRDGQVEDHDRAHHARPPHRHRIGPFGRSDGQPDRRERPAESVTGSDAAAGQQHRAHRREHEPGGRRLPSIHGRRSLERSDTEQQAQHQPDDQDETTHSFEAHQRQRPIGDRVVGDECRSPRARVPMLGVQVRGRSRAGRRPPSGSCPARSRDRGTTTGRNQLHAVDERRGGGERSPTATTTPVTTPSTSAAKTAAHSGCALAPVESSGEPRCPRDGAESDGTPAEPASRVRHAPSRPFARAGPAVDRTISSSACRRSVLSAVQGGCRWPIASLARGYREA